jgi:hypothetical protein
MKVTELTEMSGDVRAARRMRRVRGGLGGWGWGWGEPGRLNAAAMLTAGHSSEAECRESRRDCKWEGFTKEQQLVCHACSRAE